MESSKSPPTDTTDPNTTKWEYGIDFDTANRDDVVAYVKYKTVIYATGDFTDRTLWDLFQHDFEDVTLDTLKTVPYQYLLQLRMALRRGGVWVDQNSKEKKITIAQTIIKAKNEKTRPMWTKEKVKEHIEEIAAGTMLRGTR